MYSRFKKSALIILLSLAAYFIAGYFIDLPPYGIQLKETNTTIIITPPKATVQTSLHYYCRSWRPRKNSFYLPFETFEKVLLYIQFIRIFLKQLSIIKG